MEWLGSSAGWIGRPPPRLATCLDRAWLCPRSAACQCNRLKTTRARRRWDPQRLALGLPRRLQPRQVRLGGQMDRIWVTAIRCSLGGLGARGTKYNQARQADKAVKRGLGAVASAAA
jgi:hypothetical protein